MQYTQYITCCSTCGGYTSRKYARRHKGQCKPCAEPDASRHTQQPTREQRILDYGYQAYAQEEGHYE